METNRSINGLPQKIKAQHGQAMAAYVRGDSVVGDKLGAAAMGAMIHGGFSHSAKQASACYRTAGGLRLRWSA